MKNDNKICTFIMLLTIVTLLTITSCLSILYCISSSNAAEDATGMYIKGSIGLANVQNGGKNYNGIISKIKSKGDTPVIELGVGYNAGNNYRIEGVMNYYFQFAHKEKAETENYAFDLNLDTKVTTVMMNLYKDVDINDKIKFFAGSGVGIAYIKDECTGNFQCKDDPNHECKLLPTANGKKVFRLSYGIMSGISYKFSDTLVGEATYHYLYLGKNKPQYEQGLANIAPRSFKAHTAMLGLRVIL